MHTSSSTGISHSSCVGGGFPGCSLLTAYLKEELLDGRFMMNFHVTVFCTATPCSNAVGILHHYAVYDIGLGAFAESELDKVFSGYQPH
jgi:hypothetical protein